MNRLKHFFFIFPLLFFSSIVFAVPLPAETLTALLNCFHTYQADFSQTTTSNHHRVLQKSSGVMMLMRPNHFRWETKTPDHQIVITNGKIVWIYDVDLQQVTKQSVENTPTNPAELLSGNTAQLLRQFDVQLMQGANQQIFLLIPKTPNQTFQSVRIIFKNKKLTQMQIQNSLSQTSTFIFSHIVINPVFSPTLFSFTAPKNVDVLK